MNTLELQQKAAQLLIASDCAGTFPVPVEKIATYLGFSCHYFTPDATTENISGAVNHAKKKIYINPNESPKRQQFTMAHEIGHIVLHSRDGDHIDYRIRHDVLEPKELESNFFAANLLMPVEMFIYQWNQLNKSLDELSNFFGVNTSAIAVRATSLNLD